MKVYISYNRTKINLRLKFFCKRWLNNDMDETKIKNTRGGKRFEKVTEPIKNFIVEKT